VPIFDIVWLPATILDIVWVHATILDIIRVRVALVIADPVCTGTLDIVRVHTTILAIIRIFATIPDVAAPSSSASLCDPVRHDDQVGDGWFHGEGSGRECVVPQRWLGIGDM
jgi:hypothetical protein